MITKFSFCLMLKYVWTPPYSFAWKIRSSLIYNTSIRHEQHECNENATRVQHECNTSNTSATRVKHEQRECNTSATRILRKRNEYDTSATRTTQVWHEWKVLTLITTLVKAYFHTLIFAIWQVKDYKERNNFFLRTIVWKCLVSMPKCI